MRPIYYDTETTGLKSEKDRVIEIAMYDPIKKKEFVSFINPGIPIPDESTKITGITDEMVKSAPTFSEIIPDFLNFCNDGCILVAHNNDSFDIHFLKAEFERAKVVFPDFKFIDTLKWARKYRTDLPKHNLQYLREVYQIEKNNAHRALDDVIVLEKVFSIMIDDLPIDTVWDMLYKKPIQQQITTMPFGKHKGTAINKLPNNYVEWLMKSGALDKPENIELKKILEVNFVANK